MLENKKQSWAVLAAHFLSVYE